ncbi:MAG: hypothetical protein AB7O52_15370 [Planctomycetota bacterium]
MKVLCLSHSSRPFFEARCTVNAFEHRFGGPPPTAVPPLAQFAGVESAVPYRGALTLWELEGAAETFRFRFLRCYDPLYKVQSAVFDRDRLLVYGADRLEVLDSGFRLRTTIRDPWMVGGHTVFLDPHGHAWVSCSPANAALRIDLERGAVVERLRMPERYGRHYELVPESDLHAHYIPTDLQETHLNCVYPVGPKLLVTLLRQGALGEFDEHRNYREIARGFRGCHGGKLEPDTGELMLADSPTGIVWFLDREDGRVRGRLDLQCRWLHDAHPLGGGHFVATIADSNCVRVVSRAGEVRCELDGAPFGKSVMFATVCDLDASWRKVLPSAVRRRPATAPPPELGVELRPSIVTSAWTVVTEVGAECVPVVRSRVPVRHEYLWMSDSVSLEAGVYELEAELEVTQGGVMIGLLDNERESWIETLVFDGVTPHGQTSLTVAATTQGRIVLAANNPLHSLCVEVRVARVSLRKHTPAAEPAAPAAAEDPAGADRRPEAE